MQFTHYPLGNISRGDVVEVTLQGSAANVRLMDTTNFGSYKSGRRHRYHGGLAQRSPVRLAVPTSGTWHVVIDMQGLRGSTRSSVRVVPAEAMQPLPPIANPSLRDVPTLLRDVEAGSNYDDAVPSEEVYDVFISHASEDKGQVVRPLAAALQASGLKVWYDEFELRIGDSLRRRIDRGLARSRFGVVVLSPAFFGRDWPEYELDGLVTKAVSGEQVLLPIWHNVTKQQVVGYSPSLADRLARTTATQTVEEIAVEIADLIRRPQRN